MERFLGSIQNRENLTVLFVWFIAFPINVVLFLVDWSIISIVKFLHILFIPMATFERVQNAIQELKRENL